MSFVLVGSLASLMMRYKEDKMRLTTDSFTAQQFKEHDAMVRVGQMIGQSRYHRQIGDRYFTIAIIFGAEIQLCAYTSQAAARQMNQPDTPVYYHGICCSSPNDDLSFFKRVKHQAAPGLFEAMIEALTSIPDDVPDPWHEAVYQTSLVKGHGVQVIEPYRSYLARVRDAAMSGAEMPPEPEDKSRIKFMDPYPHLAPGWLAVLGRQRLRIPRA